MIGYWDYSWTNFRVSNKIFFIFEDLKLFKIRNSYLLFSVQLFGDRWKLWLKYFWFSKISRKISFRAPSDQSVDKALQLFCFYLHLSWAFFRNFNLKKLYLTSALKIHRKEIKSGYLFICPKRWGRFGLPVSQKGPIDLHLGTMNTFWRFLEINWLIWVPIEWCKFETVQGLINKDQIWYGIFSFFFWLGALNSRFNNFFGF